MKHFEKFPPTTGLWRFQIYYEPADTDDPRVPIDELRANTMGEALQKAAEYLEVPTHDLVAVQLEENNNNG